MQQDTAVPEGFACCLSVLRCCCCCASGTCTQVAASLGGVSAPPAIVKVAGSTQLRLLYRSKGDKGRLPGQDDGADRPADDEGRRVGAWNFATLGDLHVFVDDSAEPITSDDLGVGGVGLGECS